MLFRDAQMMGQHIRNSPWLPRLGRPAGRRSEASCKMRTVLEAPGCQASFSAALVTATDSLKSPVVGGKKSILPQIHRRQGTG